MRPRSPRTSSADSSYGFTFVTNCRYSAVAKHGNTGSKEEPYRHGVSAKVRVHMADIAGIKTIVEESGNSFHCKVARYLKEKEWTILVSPYYMDSATDKPREIDIVAQKIRVT